MSTLAPTVACVLEPGEATFLDADIYVFPEGCTRDELQTTSREKRQAYVVGAFEDGGYSRGALYHAGEQVLSYQKVFSDGRTKGCGDLAQRPVYRGRGEIAIGILVCMDINEPSFSLPVLVALRETNRQYRLLCVPADMGSDWFPHRQLLGQAKYADVFVALCNNTKTHGEHRCGSFVTNSAGLKVAEQSGRQPLVHTLTPSIDEIESP